MVLSAFPILYARDVGVVAAFYERLGFEEHFRLPDEKGGTVFIAMHRGAAELGVATEDSPRSLAGVEPGPGPRHEFFVYVNDVDTTFNELRDAGITVLRDPADMPWGERIGFVQDPEGNIVSLAMPTT